MSDFLTPWQATQARDADFQTRTQECVNYLIEKVNVTVSTYPEKRYIVVVFWNNMKYGPRYEHDLTVLTYAAEKAQQQLQAAGWVDAQVICRQTFCLRKLEVSL